MVVDLLEGQQVHQRRLAAHRQIRSLRRERRDRNPGSREVVLDGDARLELLERFAPVLTEVTVLEIVVAPDPQLARQPPLRHIARQVGEIPALRVTALDPVLFAKLRDVLSPHAPTRILRLGACGRVLARHGRMPEREHQRSAHQRRGARVACTAVSKRLHWRSFRSTKDSRSSIDSERILKSLSSRNWGAFGGEPGRKLTCPIRLFTARNAQGARSCCLRSKSAPRHRTRTSYSN